MRKQLLTILTIICFFVGVFLIIKGFNPTYTQPTPSTSSPSPTTAQSQEQLTFVNEVIDGDTIEIEGGQKVRLIGIDTPETVDPRRPVGCFGKEASDKAKELMEGKIVRLEKDISETDKFDRLLRYVFINQLFVNEYLVREGFAYSSSYPPDIRYQNLLNQAQDEAENNRRGLWSACPIRQ